MAFRGFSPFSVRLIAAAFLSAYCAFANDSLPMWTQKSSWVEGDNIYVTGVATHARSREEGRQRAFANGQNEFGNLLGGKMPVQILTKMTHEIQEGDGGFTVYRLLVARRSTAKKTIPEAGDKSEALMLAAERSDLAAVEHLLTSGADPNCTDGGANTPLHFAASHGSVEIVQTLLSHGAGLNPLNGNRQTPLMAAIASNFPDIAKLLLGRGADANIEDAEGNTPLMYELCHNKLNKGDHSLLVKLLIEKTKDVDAEAQNGNRALCCAPLSTEFPLTLLRRGANANTECGAKLLHSAVRSYDLITTRALLEKGAPQNSRDETGETPLTIAVKRGGREIVKVLLAGGADPNIGGTTPDRKDTTDVSPLSLALMFGQQLDTANLLLAAGADPNSKDSKGFTPLMHLPGGKDSDAFVRLLVANKADVNVVNEAGESALCVSAGENDIAGMKALLSAGALINPLKREQLSPLFVAAQSGALQAVQFLLRKGANPNYRTTNKEHAGETPLLAATDYFLGDHGAADLLGYGSDADHKKKIDLLLRSGANVDLSDDRGVTALSHGLQYGWVAGVESLLKHDANPRLLCESQYRPSPGFNKNGRRLSDLIRQYGVRRKWKMPERKIASQTGFEGLEWGMPAKMAQAIYPGGRIKKRQNGDTNYDVVRAFAGTSTAILSFTFLQATGLDSVNVFFPKVGREIDLTSGEYVPLAKDDAISLFKYLSNDLSSAYGTPSLSEDNLLIWSCPREARVEIGLSLSSKGSEEFADVHISYSNQLPRELKTRQ